MGVSATGFGLFCSWIPAFAFAFAKARWNDGVGFNQRCPSSNLVGSFSERGLLDTCVCTNDAMGGVVLCGLGFTGIFCRLFLFGLFGVVRVW